MDKVICLLDNEYLLTEPIIDALVGFKKTHLSNTVDSVFLLFFHLIRVYKEEGKAQYADEIQKNRSKFLRLIENAQIEDTFKVQYCPLLYEVPVKRRYDVEVRKVITLIEDWIKRITEWDYIDKEKVLILQDVSLEFSSPYSNEPPESTATVFSAIMYHCLIDAHYKTKLYTSYSDETKRLEAWYDNYKKRYKKDLRGKVNAISRVELVSTTFNKERGEQIYNGVE